MQTIKGQFNEATIYATIIENEAISQIYSLINCEAYKESKIRMMPDCHAGAGCTVGTTMTLHGKVCPNLVGVDIGCGMLVVELGKVDIDMKVFDAACHEAIKSGMEIYGQYDRKSCFTTPKKAKESEELLDKIKADNADIKRALRSIGSLGGGNHFVELDKDDDGNIYLVIHSGSRHLGLEVAKCYQRKAWEEILNNRKQKDELISKLKKEGREKEIQEALAHYYDEAPKVSKDLAWCEGKLYDDYLHDVDICQKFAVWSRESMMNRLINYYNNHADNVLEIKETWTTIHNYIDIKNNILRKGSVSANAGEKLIIPMNMKDGSLICIGKGNPEWNYSAPHGAGRIMSRSQAKKNISMEDFKRSMEGIYSSTVIESTIDEAPQAYKPAKQIIEDIADTVDVVNVIKPIYNFKASE